MADSVDMTGFYTDPWASPSPAMDYSSYSMPSASDYDYSPSVNTYDFSLFNSAQAAPLPDSSVSTVAAASVSPTPFNSTTYSSPSTANDWLKSAQNVVDFGLKVVNSVVSTQGQLQDASLNRYLKTAQVDIAKTQAAAAMDVAKTNATTAEKVAMLRANAANTGAVATNLGASVGNNSLMLLLTIAGVVFAFVQVIQSAHK